MKVVGEKVDIKSWGNDQVVVSQKVVKVVSQKSIPTEISQHVLHIGNSKGRVDGFVGELTSAKRLEKLFVCDEFHQRPFEGSVREAPRFGPLSLAPVSSKELKERAFQGVLWALLLT